MSSEHKKMNQVPSTALVKINQDVWKDYLAAQDARLPALPAVEHVSDRVVRILGGNAGWMRLQGTNTYVVGTGSSRILIDTAQGEPIWIEHIKQVLGALGVTLSHVLLTHWHRDHTGGIPDLLTSYPECSGSIFKCEPDRSQKSITNGQVFRVEGATLRAIFTPGHSHDHMCFKLEEENALFTGDNVLGHGQSVFEDLGLFTQSLSVMAGLACQVGYPAHGDVINDLPRKLRELVRQREHHERQIYQTLSSSKQVAVENGKMGKGSLAIPKLVEMLYGRVDPEAYKGAVHPAVSGILEKLAEDRKVGFEMVEGEKRWFIRDQARSAARNAKRRTATSEAEVTSLAA